jgi:hypothetical protein
MIGGAATGDEGAAPWVVYDRSQSLGQVELGLGAADELGLLGAEPLEEAVGTGVGVGDAVGVDVSVGAAEPVGEDESTGLAESVASTSCA